jgi:threonine dehydrogenase-like Zn-dependent dehydrogenase
MSARCDSSQLLGWRNPSDSAGLHGAQSEYIRIPAAAGSLYRLPAEISDDEGLLLGDIASTAAYAAAQGGLAGWDKSNGNPVFALEQLLSQTLELGEGTIRVKSLLERGGGAAPRDKPVHVVIGCGPVGLLAIALAKLMLLLRGYSDVCIFAVDAVPERLEFARRWGATPLLLQLPGSPPAAAAEPGYREDLRAMPTSEIVSAVRAASLARGRSGRGADAVIECVGANSALLSAFELVAPCGAVSSIGVHSTQFPFSPADVYDKNMTYKSGRCPARSLMASVEKLLRISKEPENGLGCHMMLTDIITHKFPLSDGAKGYETFDKKQDGCIKAVLYP